MKIKYNAPVTLTFALLSAAVLIADRLTENSLILSFFSVPGKGSFDFSSPIQYARLATHILGHAGWAHLLGNFSIILLIGPILEEKYGSFPLFMMILTTSLVTGIINIFFFPTGLLGASGAAFMMILLAPFTNSRSGEIPLTFILIIALYVTKQVIGSFQNNTIAEFAHLAGGACGSIFGFLHLHAKEESLPEYPVDADD